MTRKQVAVHPGEILIRGMHGGIGDKEFFGHGPEFKMTVKIIRRANLLIVEAETLWKETGGDNTTFVGRESRNFFNANQIGENARVVSVNDQLTADGIIEETTTAILSGHGVHRLRGNALVYEFEVEGDKYGGIVGGDDEPWVRAIFKPVQVELET